MRGQDGIRLGKRLLPKRQGAHPPALLLFNHVGSRATPLIFLRPVLQSPKTGVREEYRVTLASWRSFFKQMGDAALKGECEK